MSEISVTALKSAYEEIENACDLDSPRAKPWAISSDAINVVGVDVDKPHWYENNLVQELGLPLVAYDGKNIPVKTDSIDLILLFGVLEHVGVWQDNGTKYQNRNPD
ncbi:MAG: hypothetical protein ABEI86_00470, partial [Halobacteriaceae archaeon]